MKQEKETGGIQTGKEEVKLSAYMWHHLIYT